MNEFEDKPKVTNVVDLSTRRVEKKPESTEPQYDPLKNTSINIRSFKEVSIVLGLHSVALEKLRESLLAQDAQIGRIISVLDEYHANFNILMASLDGVKEIFRTTAESKNKEKAILISRVDALEKEIAVLKTPFVVRLFRKLFK